MATVAAASAAAAAPDAANVAVPLADNAAEVLGQDPQDQLQKMVPRPQYLQESQ